MARPKIGEFVNQVKTEAGKIVWPKSRETMQTTIMVLIMTTLLALFFLGIATFFNAVVHWLTSLARCSAQQQDRTNVVSGKSVSVRLDLGGRRIITKKHIVVTL